MKIPQPFHAGEISVQTELAERDIAIRNGQLYEDSINERAHDFVSQQSFLILSYVQNSEHIPMTIIFGKPGFILVNNSGKEILISLEMHSNQNQDPVLRRLTENSKIGALVIEFATRRRLRINGHVKKYNGKEIILTVDESYPNCPMYIQKRSIDFNMQNSSATESLEEGKKLEDRHFELIKQADTFFVSSMNPKGHADASHRGGNSGFIQILANGDLRIPDYRGNSLYNTFGNFKLNPSAGILFWDFEKSKFLHLYGDVTLDFNHSEELIETGGTGRWWIFKTKSWEMQTVKVPFKIRFQGYSPFNP